jgi:hypothetical protein
MIDSNKTKDIGSPTMAPSQFKWHALPMETLLRYKLEIEAHLPPTKLKDVNVESELVNQLRIAQMLQAKVIDLDDTEIPLNQIVQAVNSVSGAIEKLAKLQIELANAENLKKMEMAFIRAVKDLPDEAVENFFKRYETLTGELGVEK